MTKVAIVTRTSARPFFLERAVQSVSNQTYKDYRHYIINDSDGQLDESRIYKDLDENSKSKIVVIDRNEASHAPDTIFTKSVDSTESEYVVIHDDDDTWHEDFLKITVEHLENDKKNGGVLVRTDKVIEEVTSSGLIQLKKKHYMPDLKDVSIYRQCAENQLTPISFIYRRKAYEDVGKYNSELPVCSDWEFGIRFLMKYDVDYIDPGFALANYHHRKSAKRKKGDNSFSQHSHRYYSNKIRNMYLRQELKEGRLGVGYIMSQIKYNQVVMSGYFKRLLPMSLVEKIKNRLRD